MLKLTLAISLIFCFFFSTALAGPYGVRGNQQQYYNRGNYGNYQYQYPTSYNRQYYRQNYYQGYSSPYQRQYQGYGNGYQNYYQQNYYATPAPAPARPFWPGVNYDSAGNSYIGTKENGIYLFCNGRGCPGRG